MQQSGWTAAETGVSGQRRSRGRAIQIAHVAGGKPYRGKPLKLPVPKGLGKRPDWVQPACSGVISPNRRQKRVDRWRAYHWRRQRLGLWRRFRFPSGMIHAPVRLFGPAPFPCSLKRSCGQDVTKAVILSASGLSGPVWGGAPARLSAPRGVVLPCCRSGAADWCAPRSALHRQGVANPTHRC